MWVVVRICGKKARACYHCGRLTKARKPRPPKHQAQDRRDKAALKLRSSGRCAVCRGQGGDSAHVVTKGAHPELRHLPANLENLCRACHDRFTRHPEEWREWLRVNRPGLLERLTEAAQ